MSDAERRERLAPWYARIERGQPLRVFAYGSLLWRPGFEVRSRTPGVLADHGVANCLWTVEARGTPAAPGLGLGLLPWPGATAGGEVLEASNENAAAALEALGARELYTGCYQPIDVLVRHRERAIPALTFVIDVRHPQYAGVLDEAEQIRLVSRARGVLGSNLEYLADTAESLARAGYPLATLERVARGAHAARQSGPGDQAPGQRSGNGSAVG